jgi:L-ribulose-5-phosphate 4-epimerase
MEKAALQEGYIKFNCNFEKIRINIPGELFNLLNYWRDVLRDKNWIGSYPDGIGFGNISIRILGSDKFYITGSATGGLSALGVQHYALVDKCNPDENAIWCKGLIPASAESMSHYMIYKVVPEAASVVHIHNRPLWDKYLGSLPTTAKEVSYGTPEMAFELERILRLPQMIHRRVCIMGGHEEGIISWGISTKEAVQAMIDLEKQ